MGVDVRQTEIAHGEMDHLLSGSSLSVNSSRWINPASGLRSVKA
jgi:hypothetical protein